MYLNEIAIRIIDLSLDSCVDDITNTVVTLRKLYFHFLSYDHGDRFPFDFEPNGIPFVPKSKGILSPRSYSIEFKEKKMDIYLFGVGGRFVCK